MQIMIPVAMLPLHDRISMTILLFLRVCSGPFAFFIPKSSRHSIQRRIAGLFSCGARRVGIFLLAVTVVFGFERVSAATQTWVGALSTDFFTGSAWAGGTAPEPGDIALFSTPPTGSNNPNIGTSGTIASLCFSAGPYTMNGLPGAVLTLTSAGGQVGSAALSAIYSGTTTISAALGLGSTAANGELFFQRGGGVLMISGPISGNLNNRIFWFGLRSARYGNGAICLSGTNTFTGATIAVNYGTVEIGSDAALGASGNAVYFNGDGGTLDFDFTADNASTRNFTWGPNATAYGIGVTTGNTISIAPSSLTYTGTAAFAKSDAGTLQMTASSQFGMGALNVAGGTLDLNGFSDTAASVTAANGGNIVNSKAATTGTLTINGGSTTTPAQLGNPANIVVVPGAAGAP